MTSVIVNRCDPGAKLSCVGNCGREKDKAHAVWQQNDGFFPNNAALTIAHVVHFVENDPRHFLHDLGAAIEHAAKNLRRHDKTRGSRVDANVASHQANVFELFVQIAILLVGQRFDRRRVDDALAFLERHGNRVSARSAPQRGNSARKYTYTYTHKHTHTHTHTNTARTKR